MSDEKSQALAITLMTPEEEAIYCTAMAWHRAELRELAGAVEDAHNEDCDCPRVKVGFVDCQHYSGTHELGRGKHEVPPCDPAGACCACLCGESEDS